MSSNTPIKALGQFLAGVFDNQRQAQENPTWFVPTRLWHCPLAQQIDGYYAMFVEQAPLLTPEQPYRQRLMLLSRHMSRHNDGDLEILYRAFRDPAAIAGAAQTPERLTSIASEDLLELPGCRLHVQQNGDRFIANPPQGAKCCFDYQGKTRQVELGFDLYPDYLLSRDRGVDPDSGQGLWGALMGPYNYQKQNAFPLPSTWIFTP